MTMVATALIMALVVFIPAFILGVKEKIRGLLILNSMVYLVTWGLFMFRGVRYELRAVTGIFLVYTVGIFVCTRLGLFSGGPFYLFTSSILAALLLGFRAALVGVGLNAATLGVLGYAAAQNHLFGSPVFFATSERAFAAGGSFVVLNAISAMSVAILVRGLHRIATRQTELSRELSREKTELIDTRQRLHSEIEVRRKSVEALRQSEAQYRLLAESINDVIFTLDMKLNYTYVSPAVFNLQGWHPDELLGQNVAEMLPPRSLELAATTLAEQLAVSQATDDYKRAAVLEVEIRHKSGQLVWVEVTAAFQLDNDGRPMAIICVSRNIAERRKAQQEREALQEQLTRSKKMEALGLLAGGVAHDLNNVLSGIVSYPDLLLLDCAPSNPMRKPIEAIRESGQKAAAIVQDLLTLARRGVVTAEVLNLNTLIEQYLQSPEHRKLTSYHPDIALQTELDAELANITGSSVHLKKTVMNLVSNAAEAQPHGGTIVIRTQSRYLDRPLKGYDRVAEGEYVVMSITDQGEGIAEADLSRIFEPFYTKKVMGRSGTGLGMAVVWGTVQDHNGYIDIASTPGQGTCFSLYFPLTRSEIATHPTPPPLELFQGHGETILVVDDIPEQREIAVNLLTRLQYDVCAVASGEAAIAHVRKTQVDLLILDMIMDPGIDGLDTYRAVLANRPDQKAIIASGFAETGRVKEAQRLGVGAYVKKPYTMEKIGMAIRRTLDRP